MEGLGGAAVELEIGVAFEAALVIGEEFHGFVGFEAVAFDGGIDLGFDVADEFVFVPLGEEGPNLLPEFSRGLYFPCLLSFFQTIISFITGGYVKAEIHLKTRHLGQNRLIQAHNEIKNEFAASSARI